MPNLSGAAGAPQGGPPGSSPFNESGAARVKFWWAPWFAIRIARSRSKRRRLSSISAIAIVGVAIGVAALTVVSGITGGFQATFRDRILGLYPHLIAIKRGGEFVDYREAAHRARQAPGVVGASAATYAEMLAAHGERRVGVSIRGVDLATVEGVSKLSQAASEGSVSALDESLRLSATAASGIMVSGAVEGTVWTVALSAERPGLEFVPFRQLAGEPPGLGLSGVSLAHAAASEGPLHLVSVPVDVPPSPDDFNAARLPAWGLDADGDRARAEPRALSRQLALLGPDVVLRVERDDGSLFAEYRGALAAEATYLLLAHTDAASKPSLRLLTAETPADALPAERRAAGRSWVRAVDLRQDPGAEAVAVFGEDGGAEERVSMPPGGVSPWLQTRGRPPRILLGHALAHRLGASRGDLITLVSPLRGLGTGGLGPMGMAPTSARFEVAGTLKSGFWEYDVRLAIVELQASQRFLNRGDVAQWVDVRFADDFRVKEFAADLGRFLQPYGIDRFATGFGTLRQRYQRLIAGDVAGFSLKAPRSSVDWLGQLGSATALVGASGLDFGYKERFKLVDWEEMNHNLLSALKLQKVVLTILFLIIIVVAAFNIVGSQVMLIHDKRSDIAILKSMGATRAAISRVFLLQGTGLGAVGTAIGLVAGLGVSWLLQHYGFPLDPEVYLISELPVAIHVPEALAFGALALAFIALTVSYSAKRAGAVLPVDGLRRID